MKKIAVFDYSCGKVFGIDLPRKCKSNEEVEDILFGEDYRFKDSQVYWMEVEIFDIESLN